MENMDEYYRLKYYKYKTKFLEKNNKINKEKHHKNLNHIIFSGGSKLKSNRLFSIEDEIHFWGQQMMEHALFLHLGLEDTNETNYKAEALKVHNKWKNFMNDNFKSNPQVITLSSQDVAKINIDLNKVKQLIDLTEKFNARVINVLKSGKWIGWIFISLAEHMQKETNYFNRKVFGPDLSKEEEIEFINTHHGEEMGATAQLIDPSEEKVIKIVQSYAHKSMSEINFNTPFPKKWTKEDEKILKEHHPTDQVTLLVLSIRYGKELIQFAQDTGHKIDANQLKSVISPVLANHVLREFERFTQTLERLK